MRADRGIVAALAAFAAWAVATEAEAQVALAVDTDNRDDVIRFYLEAYLADEGYHAYHGWTGSVANCEAGTVSQALHDATIRRVNYFRAMAGLNADIALSGALNGACQEAALMMAYNNTLRHDPPASWPCYTAAGANAALASNLSSGFITPHYGPGAIVGQIADDGTGNEAAPHRRWILFSGAPAEFGHGSIPPSPIVGSPGETNTAMALHVLGNPSPSASMQRDFVAWPPPGYAPYEFAFARWSFGIPGAEVGKASVTVTKGGAEVPVSIVHRGGTTGDPSIVFEPSGFPLTAPPPEDLTYRVTVSDIGGTQASSYSYSVTLINAGSLSAPALAGPELIYIGYPSDFTFANSGTADAHELRIATASTAPWEEGAEATPIPQVLDLTSPSYPLTSATLASAGERSFHLVADGDIIEVDRDIYLTPESTLHFAHRFRYVGMGMRLLAEIESPPGTWSSVWHRYGRHGYDVIDGDWDREWTTESVSLAAFAGGTARVRFRYIWENGPDWTPLPGDILDELGAFVDSVKVTDALELQVAAVQAISAEADSVTFDPAEPGEYWLQLRAMVAGEWSPHGQPKVVQVLDSTPPTLNVLAAGFDAAGGFAIDAGADAFSSVWVERSEDGKTWATVVEASVSDLGDGVTRFTVPPANGDALYRLQATSGGVVLE